MPARTLSDRYCEMARQRRNAELAEAMRMRQERREDDVKPASYIAEIAARWLDHARDYAAQGRYDEAERASGEAELLFRWAKDRQAQEKAQ